MWPISSETRARVAGIVLVATLGVGCGTLSIDQERSLGEEFEREIRREISFFRDATVEAYVEGLGRSILDAAGPQPFPYHFYVVDDPEINAFAAPAGHVYLNTGILLNARNMTEVAGVMAHEVGHVALRHIAENYNRQRNTGLAQRTAVVLTGVLAGGNWAGAANIVGSLGAMSYLNTFGRDAEREADVFAVEVLPRAGIDPRGLVSFFETLRQQGGAKVPAFLSSHPTTDERIQRVRALIDAAELPSSLRRDDGGRFEIIQHRVRLKTGVAPNAGP